MQGPSLDVDTLGSPRPVRLSDVRDSTGIIDIVYFPTGTWEQLAAGGMMTWNAWASAGALWW